MQLAGREKELATAHVAATSGSAGIAFAGSAGTGRTALLHATTRLAEVQGSAVLTACARQAHQYTKFGLIHTLFSPLIASMPSTRRRTLLSGPATPAAALVDTSSPPAGDLADEYGVLYALFHLAARLARHQPLMIAVDDLHLADAASLRWLLFLARRTEDLPIVLATTHATGVQGPAPGLLDELAEVLTVIPVNALSLAGAADLVTDKFSRAPGPGFAEACHHITQGNPFLLTSLLDALAAEHRSPTWSSVGRLATLTPAPVSRWITGQTRATAAPVLELARAFVVLGDGADLAAAATIAGLAPRAAVAAADHLSTTGLMTGAERPVFAHLLVRNTIERDMPESTRATLHAKAARLRHERHDDAEQVAAHILAVDSFDETWTAPVLHQAAALARLRSSPKLSVRYLRRALTADPSPSTRLEIIADLGKSELECFDLVSAETHLSEALAASTEPAVITDLVTDLAALHVHRGDSDRALDLLRATTSRIASAEDLVAELTAVTLVLARNADLPEWTGKARAALESPHPLLRRTGLAITAAHVASSGDGSREEVATLVGQVLDAEPSRHRSYLLAVAIAGSAAVLADQPDLSARSVETLTAAGRVHNTANAVEWAHLIEAKIAYQRGRPERVIDEIHSALDFDEAIRGGRYDPDVYTILAQSYVDLGRLDAVRSMFAGMGLTGPEPTSPATAALLNTRGRIRLLDGNARGALADHLRFGRYAEKASKLNPACSDWRSRAAIAYHVLGKRAEAEDLAQSELDLARAWGSPRAIGIATRTLGRVRGDVGLLLESAAVLETSDADIEHARSLHELGMALLSDEKDSDARTCFHQAFRLATDCGAGSLADAALAALHRAGGRRPRSARTGTQALTQKQQQFVALAASGYTNREIAGQLCVSLRTVEHHLTSAYRVLGISSRGELKTVMPAA